MNLNRPASSNVPRWAAKTDGFVLVVSLIFIAAITLLVVGLFSSSTMERRITENHDVSLSTDQAVRTALAEAERRLKQACNSDDYLILKLTSPSSAQPEQMQFGLVAARARLGGSSPQWDCLPLISGKALPQSQPILTTDLAPLPPLVDAQGRVSPSATADLPVLPWQLPADVGWEHVYAQPIDGSPGEPIARYAFVIEDLQQYLSLDHVGNFGPTVESRLNYQTNPHTLEAPTVQTSLTQFQASPHLWYRGLVPGLRLPDGDATTDDRLWPLAQVPLYPLFVSSRESHIDLEDRLDNELIAARWMAIGSNTTNPVSLFLTPNSWRQIMLSNFMNRTQFQRVLNPTTGTQRLTGDNAQAIEENTISGLRAYHERPVIPSLPGIAAAKHRTPKLNLNRILTALADGTLTSEVAVDQIARHIDQCLPAFAERRGGFSVGRNPGDYRLNYLRNLAASIIDYADTDCMPTIDTDANYRGQDSYPVVSEQFLMVDWKSPRTAGGRHKIDIHLTFFYELWNPTNRPVAGEFEAEFDVGSSIQAGVANNPLNRSSQYITANAPYQDRAWPVLDDRWMPLHPPTPTTEEADRNKTRIELRPNEYTVVATRPVIFELDGGPASLIPVIREVTFTADATSRYKIRFRPDPASRPPQGLFEGASSMTVAPSEWRVIDFSRGGVARNARFLNTSGIDRWKQINGTIAGHSYDGNGFANNVGDPRISFFIQAPQSVVAYTDGASPWGRNWRRNVPKERLYGEVQPADWPDRGHNGMVLGIKIPSGSNTNSGRDHPFQKDIFRLGFEARRSVDSARDAARAPARISNSGRYFSATELGHIYDPIQWDANGSAADVTWRHQGAWELFQQLDSRASASRHYGGGNTLRIGRPEHLRFRPIDSGGTRALRDQTASLLLDLFHVGISTVGDVSDPNHRRDLTGPLSEIRGHLNLNTATPAALRAHLVGYLQQDPVLVEDDRSNPTNPIKLAAPSDNPMAPSGDSLAAAEFVAERIIAARPFVSTSEMADRVVATFPSARAHPREPSSPVPLLGHVEGYEKRDKTDDSQIVNEPIEPVCDAAAEELFARLYNTTTVRSRNFRIFVTAQTLASRRSQPDNPQVLATRSRCFYVHLEPVRDPETGVITNQRLQILSSHDL